MSVEVNNESGVPADETSLAALARYLLDELEVAPLAELSVLLVDTDAMAALHEQWMDLPGPTDVMAFPMDSLPDPIPGPGTPPGPIAAPGPTLLGDVVLCPAVAAEQAGPAGHSTASELSLLLAHGTLHLLGFDHGTTEEEREMFGLQAKLLTGWSATTGAEAIRTPIAGTEGKVRS